MKSNLDVLRELSMSTLSLQGGADEALAWRSELIKRKSLLFAWETELVNPKYMPDWVRIKDADFHDEIRWNSQLWSEYRIWEWKKRTGKRILLGDQICSMNISTNPKLVKIPTKKITRELFKSIVKTIPPEVDNWCAIFKRLVPQYKDEVLVSIDYKYGLSIVPRVSEFIIADSFFKSSLSQNIPFSLTEIQSPFPEIEACEELSTNRMRRQTLQPFDQDIKTSRSAEEVEATLRNDIEYVFKQAEAQIAAENSRRDKELRDTLTEYPPNQQP